MQRASDDLVELINARIEALRPKLLDLSRRNPLVSTKLSSRSNTIIRVVDELPDVLFFNLSNAQEMRFLPLPALDDEPWDEQTEAFIQAAANARLTDEDYLAAQDKLDSSSEDYLDKARKLERALKDKLRAQLGLPARSDKRETNLVQHARNNGISPSYDLPEASDDEENENHTDDNIQTLLLPKDLERKLSALVSKCNTWIQETGINVLHASFGFLEWKEINSADTSFAPLILLPVRIERNKTTEGLEFWVKGLGEEAEINTVLTEKLRLEFGIQLPSFDGGSIENYLRSVGEVSPKTLSWRVRRQVSFGVFPSARIAMYHDLDTQKSSFSTSEVISPLFGGSGSGGAVPFADDYHVDQPEFEQKVPYLVLDADASQYSTLVDVASGGNVAVEGPPGTGKSQTIVNAIAAAMASGKKVLFVSEKTAALDVVRSRLEAIGLGEFLLPLLAERSTRENVISSVRERIEMQSAVPPKHYEKQVSDFRNARDETAQYIKILTTIFQDTGLTIHEIVGKSISTGSVLDALPKELQTRQFPISNSLTQDLIKEISDQADMLSIVMRKSETCSQIWKDVRRGNLSRFDIDEILLRSKQLSVALEQVDGQILELKSLGFVCPELRINNQALKMALQTAGVLRSIDDAAIAAGIAKNRAGALINNFLNDCANYTERLSKLEIYFKDKLSENIEEAVSELDGLCRKHELDNFDAVALDQKAQINQQLVKRSRALVEKVREFSKLVDGSENWPLIYFKKIREIVDAAGRDTIYFRSDVLANPTSLILLKKYNKLGVELAEAWGALSSEILPLEDVPLEQLQQCSSALRTGGLLRIFNSEYRRAKATYTRISKNKFNRLSAAELLDKYIFWKRREKEFSNDANIISIYGTHFSGIETDFNSFSRLINYYERIREAFPALEQQSVREFLISGSADHILQSPFLDVYSDLLSAKIIEQKLNQLDEEINSLSEASKRIAKLKDIFVSEASTDAKELPAMKKEISELLEQKRRFNSAADVKSLLGIYFNGVETSIEGLTSILTVAKVIEASGEALDECCAVVARGNTLSAYDCICKLEKSIASCLQIESELVGRAGLDARSEMLNGEPLNRSKILNNASNDSDGLYVFAEVARAREAVNLAVHDIVEAYVALTGGYEGIGQTLEALAYRSLARRVFEQYGSNLLKFSGNRLNELRDRVAKTDKEIISSSRDLLRSIIQTNANPPRGIGVGRKSSYTDMALIENETSKKQRFISVRDLTRRAGKALLEIKPCWMMSPLAVAQYLPKGELCFDLCIIDEASQMTPEDAVGALSRCRQAMIVGDTNQLPPSNFFRKLVEDDDADEDETVLNESILEMANAVFRPARRLRWHYRSRHSGLIRFSNRLVYNDDLVVFPSATEAMPGMGVEFRAVKGLYKSGTNPIEAQSIVEAALRFMNESPERSLGIVTLNQKQRDLIFEEMEHALTKDRGASRYVEEWSAKNEGLEQFFIKNLENVQGDERDVIFIGTVYGPESHGARVMQRFGPINGVAGKRRLNVLFSRAKQLIVTFSSMKSSDILADASANEGAHMLKCWLEYTATGTLDGGVVEGKEPDSDFELFVIKQIQAMGCIPVPQVGVRGYSIDIGVKHPKWEHGYILGVECDGASFHSSKSARDRDRLRQEVLEGLGWKIHRIWSTDWFNNPSQQAAILRRVIEERMDELKSKEKSFIQSDIITTRPSIKVPEETLVKRTDAIKGHETVSKKGSAQQLSFLNDTNQAPVSDDHSSQSTSVNRVMVGDTVRVRYLGDDKRTVQFKISLEKSDLSNGIINYKTPIAEAILDAEEGDEIEILVGSYLKSAIVEKIMPRNHS
jgi:hypothetical protein